MEYATITRKPNTIQHTLLRPIVYAGVVGVDVAGLGLTILALLWLIFGEHSLPTWHFSSLLPGIITLSPFIALLGLFSRRRWFVFHLIPTILFISLYGGQFVPRSPAVADDTAQLRVMTFNTRYRTDTASQLAEQILSADADVVALQELSTTAANYFKTHLIDEYPYQVSYTDGASVKGKGLLSRFPLSNDRLQIIHDRALILEAEFEFDGQTIHLVSVHPSSPRYGIAYDSTFRSLQIDAILSHVDTIESPVILLGDFNTTDQSEDYRKITAHYQDSFREVGFGLGQTFPDSGAFRYIHFIPPLIRIDYIFHSDDLQAVASQVWGDSGTSDHRPVVSDFIWTKEL